MITREVLNKETIDVFIPKRESVSWRFVGGRFSCSSGISGKALTSLLCNNEYCNGYSGMVSSN